MAPSTNVSERNTFIVSERTSLCVKGQKCYNSLDPTCKRSINLCRNTSQKHMRYKDSQYKEHRLKRNNFQIPVLPCTL